MPWKKDQGGCGSRGARGRMLSHLLMLPLPPLRLLGEHRVRVRSRDSSSHLQGLHLGPRGGQGGWQSQPLAGTPAASPILGSWPKTKTDFFLRILEGKSQLGNVQGGGRPELKPPTGSNLLHRPPPGRWRRSQGKGRFAPPSHRRHAPHGGGCPWKEIPPLALAAALRSEGPGSKSPRFRGRVGGPGAV